MSANLTAEDVYFSGAGKVYLAELDATGKPLGFEHVGNAFKLDISMKADNEDKFENQTGNSLLAKRVSRKKTADASLSLDSFSKANLQRVLYGTATALTGTTVTAESCVAYPGKEIMLEHGNISTTGFSLKIGTTTNVLATTEYSIDNTYGAILIAATAATATAGTALVAAYSYGAQDEIKAFTTTGKEYALKFDGINTAEGGNKFRLKVHRFFFDPIKSWALIDDKMGSIELSGAVMADTARADGDQFYTHIDLKTA
jgi:hypothetical protein